MAQHLHLILTGGTIDSIFDGARDMVVVNDASTIAAYINDVVRPHFSLSQEVVTFRDSREITDNVRAEIVSSVEKSKHPHILITHGTYTMAETGRYLQKHLKDSNKIVVLTGSMLPLKGFSPTDAPFNLGFAIGSLFLLKPGVYLSMNGRIFGAHEAVKNIDAGRFEVRR
ncbi:MAG: asparaginase [Oligoflexia bacterium]|nr:asparaginase [Oligoflexia bacterium]